MGLNNKSIEFLTKMAALLGEYKVTIEVTESCHGYGGFSIDGIEFAIPYYNEEFDYNSEQFVELSGKHLKAEDIDMILEVPEVNLG
jgi:hypothetical protein